MNQRHESQATFLCWKFEDPQTNLELTIKQVTCFIGYFSLGDGNRHIVVAKNQFSEVCDSRLHALCRNRFVITNRRNRISDVIESGFHIRHYSILAVREAVTAIIDRTSHLSFIECASRFAARQIILLVPIASIAVHIDPVFSVTHTRRGPGTRSWTRTFRRGVCRPIPNIGWVRRRRHRRAELRVIILAVRETVTAIIDGTSHLSFM